MCELISIIIPVYNVEKFLPTCLDSVLAQTYKNIEIICINDGSTDSSAQILEDYRKRYSNIVVEHKENGGVCSARNRGLELSRGEYILFSDSDDVMPKDAIEVLYSKIKEHDADMAVGAVNVQINGAVTKKDFVNSGTTVFNGNREVIKNTVKSPFFSSCAKLISQKVISDIRFIEGRKINEDGYFIFEVLMNCEKIVSTDISVYNYLYHATSASHSGFSEKFYDILYFRDRKVKEIEAKYPDLVGIKNAIYLKHSISFLNRLVFAQDKSLNGEIRKIRKDIAINVKELSDISKKDKVKLLLIKYFFQLYKYIINRGA